MSEHSLPHYAPKWGKYRANEGQTSKASQYQHVIYQSTRLVTLNQQIHKTIFAWPWRNVLWWKMSPDQDLSDVYVTGKACNQAFHEILENFSQFSEMTNSIKHFMVTEICRFFMKWLRLRTCFYTICLKLILTKLCPLPISNIRTYWNINTSLENMSIIKKLSWKPQSLEKM